MFLPTIQRENVRFSRLKPGDKIPARAAQVKSNFSIRRIDVFDDDPTIVIPSSGESHHIPRKGYPQDALFAGNIVELSPISKVQCELRDLSGYLRPTVNTPVKNNPSVPWYLAQPRQ